MTPRFDVMPFRYSDDVEEMVKFLETLGLRRRIEAEGFAELQAASGRVMVHAAGGKFEGGQTYLNLMSSSVEDTVDVASAAGLEYLVWDEAYGRHAVVEGPHGEWMWVNEEQADDYGYTRRDAPPREGLTVSAIRPAPDFAPDREFFAHFGFTTAPGADQWFESLTAAHRGGVVGLHHAPPGAAIFRTDEQDVRDRMPVANLGFMTTEDLPALAARLTESGHPARVVTENDLTKVHVTDPDGVEIEIHPER